MKKRRRVIAMLAAATLVFGLAACGNKESSGNGAGEKEKIMVGCLARDEEIVNWIADKLSDKYDIEARVYSETVSIMQAAAEGEDQLNYIANIPYLESYNESYGSDLIYYMDQITNSPVYVISEKYKKIDEIPDGAEIAVANDNSNRERELNILVEQGLIEMNEEAVNPSVLDVTSNPKKLKLMEIDARSRVGALPDLDAETMPAMTFYQMDQETIDGCSILASESNQACVDVGGQGFCCLKENEDKEWMKDIWETACTKEFADWLTDTYGDARIPSGYWLQSGELEYKNPSFDVPDIY